MSYRDPRNVPLRTRCAAPHRAAQQTPHTFEIFFSCFLTCLKMFFSSTLFSILMLCYGECRLQFGGEKTDEVEWISLGPQTPGWLSDGCQRRAAPRQSPTPRSVVPLFCRGTNNRKSLGDTTFQVFTRGSVRHAVNLRRV